MDITGKSASIEVMSGASRKGAGYWFIQNIKRLFRSFLARHWFAFGVIILFILVVMVAWRAFWQPYLLIGRANTHYFLFGFILLVPFYLARKYGKSRKSRFGIPLAMAVIAAMYLWLSWQMHYNILEYCRLYVRYKTLSLNVLNDMPTTAHERILPQAAVRSLAKTKVTDAEHVSDPDFVRFGSRYGWIMAIEPDYPINRFTGDIQSLFFIPGNEPTPSFSTQDRIAVHFETGENLRLGKNAGANVIKSFHHPWRFINYQPADVKYLLNDAGQPVQVISLVRWEGWIFPMPTFGGVVVVPVSAGWSLKDFLKLIMLGRGRWIPPEEIKNCPFLLGQNIVPVEVSRYIAQSLRFRHGFFGPFPGRHKGDIRIADLPTDMNQQPFSIYFSLDGESQKSKIYQYFSLEPYLPELRGLNTSLLIPADGIGQIQVYYHVDHKESLFGVSAAPQKIMDDKKNYSWGDVALVAENRPWIKKIYGKTRFFWLGTVVTLNANIVKSGAENTDHPSQGKNTFIAGSVPEIALVEAEFGYVVWVDPHHLEDWTDMVSRKLNDIWQRRK